MLPLTSAMAAQNSHDVWTILPYPSYTVKPALIVSGPSFAILKSNPRQQAAAWLFIRWMIQPEHLASLVEASGTLPVRVSELDQLDTFKQRYPQWALAQQWIPVAQPAPHLTTWRHVRPILEDAAAQLFGANFSDAQVPQLLQELDQTVAEVLQKNP